MPSPNQPAELTVLDHNVHFQDSHKFDLDDPFSVQEDLQAATAFEFDADSFLDQMRSRATVGAHDEEGGEDGGLGNMSDKVPSEYGSADASVSTLDIYAMNEQAQAHASTSSSQSEEPPPEAIATRLAEESAPEKHPPSESDGLSNGSQGDQSRDVQSETGTPTSPNPPHKTLARPVPSKGRASGPSLFQQVVSKTRPPYLPPKQKEEDNKHSKEWEEMMQQSRLNEQTRREELQARRLARELTIEANTSLWEKAILPNWKKAVRDPILRKLWWDGVPTKLRSVVWERAVGNGLALHKDTYASSLARARSLLAAQRFPAAALSVMEMDIDTTLPQLHIFNRLTGPLHDDLHNLLCAWIVCRAEEGLGYVDGTAKIGAMLLLNLTGPAQAFVVMRNLLERNCMRAFYGGASSRDDVEAYYRIFDTLLADGMPKVYFNFKQHHISPAEYLPDWILPLFINHLPLEACSRIWDILLLEGDAFLFRAALALLGCIESRLFFPDRQELLDVLKGECRAALEVARREMPSLFDSRGEIVGPKYEIYGINEETVWERLTEMADWWKESTWQRLIVRELPDL